VALWRCHVIAIREILLPQLDLAACASSQGVTQETGIATLAFIL